MEDEKLFDYSRGINAPYWVQEFRTKKGKLIWYFSSPVQLSFFVIFFAILIGMLTFLSPVILFLNNMTKSISMMLYWFVPYKLAKFYCEYEPDGKPMHVFIWDYFVYLKDFKLNRKSLYQSDRVEKVKEIVFEKTKL
ncbi:conjugal transfer protein [Streptococcus canis]|uniref:conjugal transfer protein n=1 Tax=Streptococcus canis TaxID=1329 RepID=UPI002949048E|nr:conjugal transfer protein [Streptococcus canis]MDV5987568.1 conjugal transfer protein [Streptococcus canis]